MRVAGSPVSNSTSIPTISTEPLAAVDATGAVRSAEASGPLQSAVLQPALTALRAMPDVDLDRVAQLRDALAKGEVPFDAAKLAGLVQRFHGGTR